MPAKAQPIPLVAMAWLGDVEGARRMLAEGQSPNRADFFGVSPLFAAAAAGQDEIVALLQCKWARELDYRLVKELWAFSGDRIAVRFAYEWHDDAGQWMRSYGNENWEFDGNGLMRARHASINDVPILESERRLRWPSGPRPVDHPGLSDLGL